MLVTRYEANAEAESSGNDSSKNYKQLPDVDSANLFGLSGQISEVRAEYAEYGAKKVRQSTVQTANGDV